MIHDANKKDTTLDLRQMKAGGGSAGCITIGSGVGWAKAQSAAPTVSSHKRYSFRLFPRGLRCAQPTLQNK
jgi:hypothetical protein